MSSHYRISSNLGPEPERLAFESYRALAADFERMYDLRLTFEAADKIAFGALRPNFTTEASTNLEFNSVPCLDCIDGVCSLATHGGPGW